MITKTVKNINGEFLFSKEDKIERFYCERCEQSKKSKTIVEWKIKEESKTICNACFGFLTKSAE
jgi:hypothetical protein